MNVEWREFDEINTWVSRSFTGIKESYSGFHVVWPCRPLHNLWVSIELYLLVETWDRSVSICPITETVLNIYRIILRELRGLNSDPTNVAPGFLGYQTILGQKTINSWMNLRLFVQEKGTESWLLPRSLGICIPQDEKIKVSRIWA